MPRFYLGRSDARDGILRRAATEGRPYSTFDSVDRITEYFGTCCRGGPPWPPGAEFHL